MKRVCVFCGSRAGNNLAYLAAAKSLGRAIAQRGLGLVYGGASVGLMGAVADAALAEGGEVIGIIPKGLVNREVAHRGITDLAVVDSMHERKAKMAALSDALIALPGGLGTMEELFETLTWAMLGIHNKPCGLLDVADYYLPLIRFLDHSVTEGFVHPEHRALLHRHSDANDLLDALKSAPPSTMPQWIKPEEY